MKQHTLQPLLAILLTGSVLFAGCSEHKHKEKNRTIEVTGSAEKEIVPDEVYYDITLTEYLKGKKKVTMPEMEAELMKKTAALGIKKEDVQVENSSIYNYDYYYWDYWYHRKHQEYYATKTFIIKLTKPEALETLLGGNDSLNYTSAQLRKYDNSKIRDYRDSLKIQALQAAGKKAKMLLTSIGEEVGPVVSITEIESPQELNTYPYYYNYYGGIVNTLSNAVDESRSAGSQSQNSASYKDIKLRYEMKVVYEIK